MSEIQVNAINSFFTRLTFHKEYSWNKSYECFVNRSVDNITVFTTKEQFFGFYLAFIQHLLCGLSLKVLIKKKILINYEENSLILSRVAFSDLGILNGMQVPIEEKYQLTILTTSITKYDQAYMSFLSLFDPIVWILVLLFYSSYSLLLKALSHKNIDILEIITNVFRSITDNSIQEFQNLDKILKNETHFERKFNKKLVLIVLIAIWIIFSTLLTKGFSSVLLKTYFNPKKYLVVNSIEDIVEDPELSVAGNLSLYYLMATKPDEYDKLRPRVETYEKGFENKIRNKIGYQWRFLAMNEQVLEEVVSGETVLLLDSYATEFTQRMNPGFKLVMADDKYSPNYITFFISKQHSCYQKIVLSLMHCLETGIYAHMKTLEVVKEEMIGRMREQNNLANNTINQEIQSGRSKQRVIKLKELVRGVFLIYFFGNLFSIIFLIFENLLNRLSIK